MDALTGEDQGRITFEEIDQHYHLKTRSFIRLCMSPVFRDLDRRLDLKALRADGVIPIMFYLQFESYPIPLAFNAKVRTEHSVRLCRAQAPGRDGQPGAGGERLLLDMEIAVSAEGGLGDSQALGGGGGTGEMVAAGRMRGVHVMTKLLAAPGERQLIGTPEQLRRLREHPWEEPYPTPALLLSPPEGYLEQDAGEWKRQRSVWGLHNTDINQHVNVLEYITEMEDHCNRMLFGAGLPVERHRIGKLSILFRKPFFKGDPHAMQGRLFTEAAEAAEGAKSTIKGRTMMLGGIHRFDPEGGIDPRPSVTARIEGEFYGDATSQGA